MGVRAVDIWGRRVQQKEWPNTALHTDARPRGVGHGVGVER